MRDVSMVIFLPLLVGLVEH